MLLVRRISAAEVPTSTLTSPSIVAHFCLPDIQNPSGWLVELGSMASSILRSSPGSSHTFLNATSRFGGSPDEAGSPKYTCGVSAPRVVPVFLTVNSTVIGCFPSVLRGCTLRFETENGVYDKPHPKGDRGWIPCASYQRYPISSPSE